MYWYRYLLLMLSFLWGLLQASDDFPRKTCRAYPIHSDPPKIDGQLNDACWALAPFQDTFVQINPVEKSKPSQKTNFKILYDDYNLYIGIIAYDNEPDKIESQFTRRDEINNSDFIAVGLDTYFDRRTAFIFGTNPSGVMFDLLIYEDGMRQDDSWDPIWEVKTSITDSGWIAEMRIPFSQLRFANKKEQIWGFQILRKIYRNQEEDLWQYVPKNAAGLVSYFGNLTGIKNIKLTHRIELLPYTLSQLHTFQTSSGNPFTQGRDLQLDFGLDGKFGLTSDLTIDYTINPDFGQVEADPSEVNLTAFETFFKEKRPFFIEGKNIFEFPLSFGGGGMSQEKIFYSRRIGRKPHYYPQAADGFNFDYIDLPEHTRILGAAKLSGKTQKGWSIGLLEAVTNNEQASISNQGKKQKVTVEPLTNYFVTRLQKDFNKGNTSFGSIITATHRDLSQEHLNFLVRSAYSSGIDFRHQWANKTYAFDFKFFTSHLVGNPRAITLIQKSSAHYFQRPDAKHVHLDTTLTTFSGYGGNFSFGRYGNSNWRFAIGGEWRSPGLELNDLGYMRQADKLFQFTWVGYRIDNPIGIFRRVSANFSQWQGWNFAGDKLSAGASLNGGFLFKNLWGVYLGLNRQQSAFSTYLLRGGPLARYTGGWNFWFNGFSNNTRNFQTSLSTEISFNDDHISKSYQLRLGLTYKASDELNFELNPFYVFNKDNLQYVATQNFQDENRYLFARLVQNTFGLIFRLNFSPTAKLSLQYYGQPFISAGKYSHFKRITNPRARGNQRFLEFNADQIHYNMDAKVYTIDEDLDGNMDYSFGLPDFNFKEFRSNLVIRWEYRPGSTLFLVWSQSKNDFVNKGNFSLFKNLGNLFKAPPDNIFLIKLNYWLTF